MKPFALATAALLSLTLPVAAHASTIAPGVDLTLTSGATSETFLQTAPNTFAFNDGTSAITVAYVSTPAGDVFSVTDVCATIALPNSCNRYALSVTDANFANLNLGVGVSAFAATQTVLSGDVANIALDGSLALGTDTVAYTTPVSNNPVPEPASLGLLATGLFGGVNLIRRRFRI